jgi:3-oxoacyl-[acyl-carrier-protein] synthase III
VLNALLTRTFLSMHAFEQDNFDANRYRNEPSNVFFADRRLCMQDPATERPHLLIHCPRADRPLQGSWAPAAKRTTAGPMIHAKILFCSYHLPAQTLEIQELSALYPGWGASKIFEKTGIRCRHIAAPGETASDPTYAAAEQLFSRHPIARHSVDYLIFCTQAPAYVLLTSSCILRDRLGLPRACGALAVNQRRSGFVYCLSLAKGSIESGQARRVLVLTADAYSKLIHPMDKSVRTIFGDARAATLVDGVESPEAKISPCVFGTDGRGAEKLIVAAGAFRETRNDESGMAMDDQSGNRRARDNLYMDGADGAICSCTSRGRWCAGSCSRTWGRIG